jgi:ATP-dependent exoDNAse (exonuclease V) alpha subunit
MAQFDLLSWVSGGCKGGTYEGNSYRVSARALHNRGLILVEGRGTAWTATITAEGTRLLKQQARRVETERERERREGEARAERDREAQRLRARALEVLEAVTAAGGRLALTADYSEREVTQITDCLARGNLLPDGQRLAHEPTRMDPNGPGPRRDRLP